MNTLLIPCWTRPEFLWHCLDNLTRCEGIRDVLTMFKPDMGHDLANLQVIDEFRDRLGPVEVIRPTPHRHRMTKQSSNLLNGYRIAAENSDELVFMVEEDVMVARDFFRFHATLHAQEPTLFCSLSTANHNRKVDMEDTPDAYYLTHLDYCSLGVCFRRERILSDILPHAGEKYFRSPMLYVHRTFPTSILNTSMCEQDGLIRRIQEARPDLPIAYPHRPRAFHAGIYGYNRPKRVTGTVKDKTTRLGSIIYDQAAVLANSLRPEFYADSIPVDLDTPAWTSLRRLQPASISEALLHSPYGS